VLADVIGAALQNIGGGSDNVQIDLSPHIPAVMSDPALLERSLANIISNALRHTPADQAVRVEAGAVGETVHVRIIDRGPGVPSGDRTRVTLPFQRLGDQRTNDGVGLGFSIAEGFVHAMHGTLTLDDTPGGGLTVTITLPTASEAAA